MAVVGGSGGLRAAAWQAEGGEPGQPAVCEGLKGLQLGVGGCELHAQLSDDSVGRWRGRRGSVHRQLGGLAGCGSVGRLPSGRVERGEGVAWRAAVRQEGLHRGRRVGEVERLGREGCV